MAIAIRDYNPSSPGVKGTLFGLPHSLEESDVIIYTVPWDATVSYHGGASYGPKSILDASVQLDLEIPNEEAPWRRGIHMLPIDGKIKSKNDILRSQIEPYIKSLEEGKSYEDEKVLLNKVNSETESLRKDIYQDTLELLKKGKWVGFLGGDHSCPLGFIQALGKVHDDFGVLQIDAHMDLRNAYEGFEHSHASIMRNSLHSKSVSKLVQVGIRDFCEEELEYQKTDDRVIVYYDHVLKSSLFEGETWQSLCQQMIDQLPDKVYVSLDIDGLNPIFCTGTGTPVPGGLEFSEVVYLLEMIVRSGKQIIGFDLCEVAPKANDEEWNANVGARLLYQLCRLIGK
ncbi:MAG: agmatinase family protein [Reichenbachiella sp.]